MLFSIVRNDTMESKVLLPRFYNFLASRIIEEEA